MVEDNGSIERRRAEIRKLRRRGQRADLPGAARCEVSSDVFFYTRAARCGRPTTCRNGRQDGDRPSRPGSTCRWGRRRRPGAEQEVARTRSAKKNETDRPWSAGENIQLAVGQGDLQTDPLQMAIAYATLGNGGTVVTPHLGKEVTDAAGRVLQEIDPGPRRHVKINPRIAAADHGRAARRAARARKARRPAVFGEFPIPIAGKTGTAERPRPRQPVLVHLPRPVPEPEHRHRGDDRGRRLRRRIGGARQQADPGSVFRSSSNKKRRRSLETQRREAPDDVRDAGAAGAARALRRTADDRRAPRPRPHGLGAHLRRDRAGRLQRLHPRPGDPERRSGQPALLRRAPGDLRHRSGSSGC